VIEMLKRIAQLPSVTDKKLLFIVCGYLQGRKHNDNLEWTPSPKSRVGRLLNSVRSNNKFHTDWYANPRDLKYLYDMIDLFIRENKIAPGNDIVIDKGLGRDMPSDLRTRFRDVEFASPEIPQSWRSGLLFKLKTGDYDCVVLVYSDALGLGCEMVERAVMSSPVKSVFVINGRKRAFPLNRGTILQLTLRRFMGRTRISELVFAILVIPTAAVCAGIDFLVKRSQYGS
jgi:hypothetical protein